ncbi:MAG: TIR domain-containing protein [Tepidisphaeraceae bacterium]
MAGPLLEEVFKIGGVPTYTFVEPEEFPRLKVSLRTPGRPVIIEGPSGIGKTSAVRTALKELGMSSSVTPLTPRKVADIDYIRELPSLGDVGTVIIDDFHKLPNELRATIADYAKHLADEARDGTKLVLIGINQAGRRLISLATDLNNRVDIIPMGSSSDSQVRTLIKKGEAALNIDINVADEIADESQGSFYIAQMLCHAVCVRSSVLDRADAAVPIKTTVSFSLVKSEVVEKLELTFGDRCKRFCRGSKLRPEGRAPYLHVMNWLASAKDWTLQLDDAMHQHPNLKGSVNQVVEKGYLESLIAGDSELSDVIHYDRAAGQLTVQDPQFVFYVRNISWNSFAKKLGYSSVKFDRKYDFALSFAGANRGVAEQLFQALIDRDHAVFYDKNEEYRIAGEDVEKYLLPIYQSEARYVVPLFSQEYPSRVWTKIESDAFRSRIPDGDVVPVRWSTLPGSNFDETTQRGYLTFDPMADSKSQIEHIAEQLCRKLADARRGATEK